MHGFGLLDRLNGFYVSLRGLVPGHCWPPPSFARVAATQDFMQVGEFDPGVVSGGDGGTVAQQDLHVTQSGSAGQHMSGARMPQGMRLHSLQAHLLGAFADRASEPAGEGLPEAVEKKVGFIGAGDQKGADPG